jgi:uncharacterized protein (DUF1800 family)
MDNIKQVKHLLARAGFGMRFEDLKHYDDASIKKVVKKLFEESVGDDPINVGNDNTSYDMLIKGDVATKKMFLKEQREMEKSLNSGWMTKMSTTDAPLREKMSLFWNNHFACRTLKGGHAEQLLNIERSNALGNFRTMVSQVSKSPAMLQFLNNQQNRKNHPNENFARELMELFTVGRGNYTEQDIKESARAFTGWGFDKDSGFKMRPFFHDDGQKTFMGKTGNFDGDDIIKILLERKETAHFVCNKLYKYLVNEIPDDAHVSAMANIFYNADYEIKPLLEYVFNADWFYDQKNTGNIIKSPVELLVGLNRQFYITYENPQVQLLFQKALGQVLFYPPNVAGWPGGRNWIDTSSLMYRIKIPSTLLNGGLIDFQGKADPEDEAYLATVKNQQQFVATRVQAQPDWDKFLSSIPHNDSKTAVAKFLLEPALSTTLINTIGQTADLKAAAIEIVSTPEYQLC